MEPIHAALWNLAVAAPPDSRMNLVFLTLLLFVPFYHRGQRLPAAAFAVFVVVSALPGGDGVPDTIILHGAFLVLVTLGTGLILAAWARLYRLGVYGAVRRPQYIGFLVVALGLLLRRPGAVPALLWGVLVVVNVTCARRRSPTSPP